MSKFQLVVLKTERRISSPLQLNVSALIITEEKFVDLTGISPAVGLINELLIYLNIGNVVFN